MPGVANVTGEVSKRAKLFPIQVMEAKATSARASGSLGVVATY